MRNIFILTFILLITCLKAEVFAGNEEDAQVVKITKADFLTKIMDYEKNPNEWKYQGSLPCVVDFYAD